MYSPPRPPPWGPCAHFTYCFEKLVLEKLRGWCAGRKADAEALAGNRVRRVANLRLAQIDSRTRMTSDERDVEQTERVAEIAMVRRGRAAGPIGCEPVGRMIVRNDDGVAVGIIAADVAPIDGAAADDEHERRRNGAGQERRARYTHDSRFSNVAAGRGHCQTPHKLRVAERRLSRTLRRSLDRAQQTGP
jgi:hypothetical protein